MTLTNTKLLTADDLLRLYSEGVRGELVRGVLSETMPAGYEHGKIVAKLTIRLGTFVESQNLGDLTASDSGVWLERNPDTVREPDIAYFSTEKSVTSYLLSEPLCGTPTLAIDEPCQLDINHDGGHEPWLLLALAITGMR